MVELDSSVSSHIKNNIVRLFNEKGTYAIQERYKFLINNLKEYKVNK